MTATEKPPYRVPSMAEIAAIPWNGLTVVSTFAGAGGSSTGYRMAGYRVMLANEFVPIAQESYAANMGPHTQLAREDIKALTAQMILKRTGLRRGELDVLDGSPPCFTAAASILTRNGPMSIADIKVGDVVLTHKLRWRRVTATFQRRAPTVIVKGQGHPGLVTTAEHPFWARRQGRRPREFAAPEWINAAGLRPNRKPSHHKGSVSWFWAAPAEFPKSYPPPIPQYNARSHKFDVGSPAFMYFVGAWLGDGWLRTGKTSKGGAHRGEVLLCSSKAEAAETEDHLRAAGLRFSRSEERTTTRFLIASKPLTVWLDKHFGRYSIGKRLPAWVLGMSAELRRALLDGYESADGHTAIQTKGDGKVRRFTTVNKELAIGFRMLAGSLGITGTVVWNDRPPQTIIEGRTVNQRGFYQLTLYEKSRSAFFDLGMLWGKVRSVRKTGIEEDVFNFEVDEDNSYVTDGIVVHNCQAFSTAGKREKGWGTDRHYEHGASQRNEDLFEEYARLVGGLEPRTFVAENVSGLVKGTAKGYFLEILRALKAAGPGYDVEARLLDAQWLGVPQARQRIIFVGVRKDLAARGFKPAFPEPLPYRYSVRDALPWLSKAQMIVGNERFNPKFGSTDAPTPTIVASGARTSGMDHAARIEAETDISRYAIGDEYDRLNPGQQSDRFFSLVRADADSPSPAITALSGASSVAGVVHPTEKRKFSILEVKRLCSFPDDFVLKGTFGQAWERLGNSVPPIMMFYVAAALRDRVLLPASEAGSGCRGKSRPRRREPATARAASLRRLAAAASPAADSPLRPPAKPSGAKRRGRS